MAVPAAVVLVAPADPIALLEDFAVRAERFDYSDAFVAERHVGFAVVDVGAAEARGGDAEVDLVAGELGFGQLSDSTMEPSFDCL